MIKKHQKIDASIVWDGHLTRLFLYRDRKAALRDLLGGFSIKHYSEFFWIV
ncbi:MAG: hypothetical protein VKL41_06675 [Snowella sp.]|nr:hypothetical protein [Snowella sp.]